MLDSGFFRFKPEFVPRLGAMVPDILKSQDPKTGRFGTGIWIVTDQNSLFPLAAAWSTPGTPFYKSPEVLEAILRGGEALIDAADPRGMWVFRTKDNSTWGDIYMPWTYSRWVRAYALIREADIPAKRRERWEAALRLGYDGISRTAFSGTMANIPAHHAMGLYQAGKLFERRDWMAQASDYLHRVCAAQDPAGFWTEHSGPVVGYNYVYVDALGAYVGLSGDRAILPALERAAAFHAGFTYPNGSSVETVDERQVYDPSIIMPGAGFSFSDLGRGYIAEQWARVLKSRKGWLAPDTLAGFVLYAQDGPARPTATGQDRGRAITGHSDALTVREKPWFYALSAYHAPISASRWIQDRQNLVSVFHDRTGLIVGGGNSKLTPLWSTFTVGDVSHWAHRPGDENPDFIPPPTGPFPVPVDAALNAGTQTLDLQYGPDGAVRCRVEIVVESSNRLRLVYSVVRFPADNSPVAGHIVLLAKHNRGWKTAAGRRGRLTQTPLTLKAEEIGGYFEHNGWRVLPPPGSTIEWPALPHNQYKKDGSAEITQARLVLCLPFTPDRARMETVIEIPPPA